MSNNSLEDPVGVQEIQVTQESQEGQDSLDKQVFLENQVDQEDQVTFSNDLNDNPKLLY